MTLTFKHFDTRLNQWLHFDGNTNNPDSLVEEKLDNTLLGFFLPEREFSFGQMDEYSTFQDLKNHPDSHQLLLSSKERLLYGSEECLEVINKLCPDRKDRGAYGSIFLGSCNNVIQEKLNVLVVDDKTGENGGIIEQNQAWRLTGDCYGQIDPKLHDLLTNRALDDNREYAVSQHRFGWRETDGEDRAFRFGKGTLRPYKLDNLKYVDAETAPKIDLIVPLSSFKGTDKDNPDGPSKPQIAPGLYEQTVWLGEKSQSQQGKTAISQLLASFPGGLKDFIDKVEYQAKELAEVQEDPRLVAQLYCENYEKRQAQSQEVDEDELAEIEETKNSDREESAMYKIIKADVVSGHYQLLETEKVKQELNRFLQKRWRDIAIGRTLTFDRGLIIPSKELRDGEIYVPWMDEGEKVLNFRSPFLNSNGLCVSVNKFTKDALGPDGQTLRGVIVVNDEDLQRIRARVSALEAEGISAETIPAETESERQGRDFDGDCIGVALACSYPNLTKEAEYRNLPENAYSPTVKQAKQSFYNSDGTQPEFEEIAIFMAKGNVGVINNQVTSLEALESEIGILSTYGTKEQLHNYVNEVSDRYNKLLYIEQKYNKPIRKEYKSLLQELTFLAKNISKNPENVGKILDLNRQIYRNLIEEGCFQNQVAVDNFKSSKPPDMELIEENRRYLPRSVNYIKDKKLPTAYLNKPISTSGSSPVELLISQTNQDFLSAALESRSAVQFSDLFRDTEFTSQQELTVTAVKRQYDERLQEAVRLNNRLKTNSGPYAVIQLSDRKTVEITDLAKYAHPGIWQGKSVNMQLKQDPDDPSKILAVAQIDVEIAEGKPKYRDLGIVALDSIKALQLKDGMAVSGSILEVKPQLQASEIKLAFAKASSIAKDFYDSIPESDRSSVAAAAWHISTKRESEDVKAVDAKKVSSFVFQAFSNEIAANLQQLQLTDLKITGINRVENFANRWTSQNNYPVEIVAGDKEGNVARQICLTDNAGNQALMALDSESSRLPIGAKAIATVIPDESATISATVAISGKPPINFTIREVSKFNYSDKIFAGENVDLTIGSALIPSNKVNVEIDGKVLGELDKDSAKDFADIDLDYKTALKLKLTLHPASQKYGSFIIGESANGKLLKINKVDIDTFNKSNIDSTKFNEVRLESAQSVRKDAVFFNNKLLGTLHRKDERDALKQLGLTQVGKLVQGTYKLESNFTTAKVIVDPNTIEYPQQWTKEKDSATELTDRDIENTSILTKLKERPTFLFATKEDKTFGLVNLAVDENKISVLETWLKARSIEFEKVPQQETTIEARKGMVLYSLASSTIAERDFAALKAKYGEVMDADSYQNSLAFVPERLVRQTTSIVERSPLSELSSTSVTVNSLVRPTPIDEKYIEASQQQIPLPARTINPTSQQDLLQVTQGIIVHQVNCQGKMGAGLAKDIAQKWPQVQAAYQSRAWQLGEVQFVPVSKIGEAKLVIANVAGQDKYGTGARQTDFDALKIGLEKVARYAQDNNLPIYLPEGLGSGLAGGKDNQERDATWQHVKTIIGQTCPNATVCCKPITASIKNSLPATLDRKTNLELKSTSSLQPTANVVRDRWEYNLINSAFAALKGSSATDGTTRSANLGEKHSVTYNELDNKLSIVNDSSKQIVYQAVRGQAATIDKLTKEQKQYFSDRTTPINPTKSRNNAANNSNSISSSSNGIAPASEPIGDRALSSTQIDSLYQADLKIAVKGLIAGNKLAQIKQEILEQSKAIANWHSSETPAKALANTVQYLDKLCEDAETYKFLATMKDLPSEENIESDRHQTLLEEKSTTGLER